LHLIFVAVALQQHLMGADCQAQLRGYELATQGCCFLKVAA
jgi:hypothetical protein